MTDAIKEIGIEGLSAGDAAKRLAADGPNELPLAKKRNLAQQALSLIHI